MSSPCLLGNACTRLLGIQLGVDLLGPRVDLGSASRGADEWCPSRDKTRAHRQHMRGPVAPRPPVGCVSHVCCLDGRGVVPLLNCGPPTLPFPLSLVCFFPFSAHHRLTSRIAWLFHPLFPDNKKGCAAGRVIYRHCCFQCLE